MKYRWLVPALGRKVGDVEDIADKRVEVWCKAGMVEPVKAKRTTSPVPTVTEEAKDGGDQSPA